MKRIISILFLSALVLAVTAYSPITGGNLTVKADGGKNIALNKPVESSGSINIDTQQDYNVTDGEYDSKWCAGRPDFNDELYEWGKEGHFIIIDLRDTYEISKFAIFQASSGDKDRGIYDFNMLQYKVEVSIDKENWQVIAEENSLNRQEEVIIREIPAVSARYFKLSSMNPSISDDFAIRIYEIEIYEDKDAEITTPEPVPTNNPNDTSPFSPPVNNGTDNQENGSRPGIKTAIIILVVCVVAGEAIVLTILIRKKSKKRISR